MLDEVLDALAPSDGETYIDGTFGAGGYSRAILDRANCNVLGIDRDLSAVIDAAQVCEDYPERLTVVHARFGAMEEVATAFLAAEAASSDASDDAAAAGLIQPDGIVLDIGVSSMQLDQAERGFSFMHDGPLDMRMTSDEDDTGSAAEFVNTADEAEIARVIYELGEDRRSRAIARGIVRARETEPITRTRQLAEIVSRAVGGRRGDDKHPATQTFQALRIHVNDELGELERALRSAEKLLKPGGRLVVVSFHSLEDRIVKRFLASRAGKEEGHSRHLPPRLLKSNAPSFRIFNSRPLTPSQGELELNPRARSARLRAAIRTDAPSWPDEEP